MLDRPGGHLGDRGREVGGAVPGQDDAGHAGALGAAQQRAEVPRIGDAGDDEQERRHTAGAGRTEVVERHRLDRLGPGEHALRRVRAGFGVEPAAGDRLHPHPPADGERLDPVELLRRVLAVGQPQLADRSATGREQLEDSLPALDLVAAELPARPRPVAPRRVPARPALPRAFRPRLAGRALGTPPTGGTTPRRRHDGAPAGVVDEGSVIGEGNVVDERRRRGSRSLRPARARRALRPGWP